MNIKLLAFGQIAEMTGQSETNVNALDTDTLKAQLVLQFPALKDMQFAMAVNKKVISENAVLKDGDTVALLPPFSGG
jgi:molybdopterin synthase sulfur carrier subunit